MQTVCIQVTGWKGRKQIKSNRGENQHEPDKESKDSRSGSIHLEKMVWTIFAAEVAKTMSNIICTLWLLYIYFKNLTLATIEWSKTKTN